MLSQRARKTVGSRPTARRTAAAVTSLIMLGSGLALAAPSALAAPAAPTSPSAVAAVSAVAGNTTSAKRAERATRAAPRAMTRRMKLRLRGLRVIAWAKQHSDAQYVAGGAGPNSFDCSGFTLAAWKTVGGYLPHYSHAQADATIRVRPGRELPGDVVLFTRNGYHHVGLYLGNGKMISASNPENDIQVSDVFSDYYKPYLTGFGRVRAPLN